MTRVPEELQKAAMESGPGKFVPPRPGVGDRWLAAVDVLVRVLTLGRGRAVRAKRCPVQWDGIVR